MKKKVAVENRKQEEAAPFALAASVQQLVLPLVIGIEATRNGLLAFVHQVGMAALQELLAIDAAALVGVKGRHVAGRTHHHWGTTKTPLPFGGRHVVVERPRVRKKGGGEAALPIIEAFRASDPLPEHVMEQILLGVSTRGYAPSLERVPESMKTRGTSKSAASRALVEKTAEKLAEFVSRPLGDVELVAMFLDAIEIAGKAAILALGVTIDGTKVPLGLALGSTENAVVATDLLQNLVSRGLRIEGAILCVIDGGKGIRKALVDVCCRAPPSAQNGAARSGARSALTSSPAPRSPRRASGRATSGSAGPRADARRRTSGCRQQTRKAADRGDAAVSRVRAHGGRPGSTAGAPSSASRRWRNSEEREGRTESPPRPSAPRWRAAPGARQARSRLRELRHRFPQILAPRHEADASPGRGARGSGPAVGHGDDGRARCLGSAALPRAAAPDGPPLSTHGSSTFDRDRSCRTRRRGECSSGASR